MEEFEDSIEDLVSFCAIPYETVTVVTRDIRFICKPEHIAFIGFTIVYRNKVTSITFCKSSFIM